MINAQMRVERYALYLRGTHIHAELEARGYHAIAGAKMKGGAFHREPLDSHTIYFKAEQ
jgi:hypothetical protein